MATQAGWATEAPAVNNIGSFEIEDATPAKLALDSNELCGTAKSVLETRYAKKRAS